MVRRWLRPYPITQTTVCQLKHTAITGDDQELELCSQESEEPHLTVHWTVVFPVARRPAIYKFKISERVSETVIRYGTLQRFRNIMRFRF